MSQVTVPVRHKGTKNLEDLRPVPRDGKNKLEDFARMIEARLKQGHGPDAVANYICRLLTSKDEKVAAMMWCKWTEWRYGKPREHIEHSGPGGIVQIINHVPRPGDRPGDDPDARDGGARDGVVLRTNKPN